MAEDFRVRIQQFTPVIRNLVTYIAGKGSAAAKASATEKAEFGQLVSKLTDAVMLLDRYDNLELQSLVTQPKHFREFERLAHDAHELRMLLFKLNKQSFEDQLRTLGENGLLSRVESLVNQTDAELAKLTKEVIH